MPERWLVTRLSQPVQPGHQPGVVELRQAIQALLVAVGDFDGPMFGAVEPRLDRRSLQFGIAGVDYPDHRQGDIEIHAAMVPVSPPACGHGQAPRALPSGQAEVAERLAQRQRERAGRVGADDFPDGQVSPVGGLPQQPGGCQHLKPGEPARGASLDREQWRLGKMFSATSGG